MNNTQEPLGLKEAIQGLSTESMEIMKFVVIADKPLQLKAVNDDKLVIGKNLVCLPKHLTDYKADCEISDIGGARITIKNALKTGETVYALSFNRGKKYYILDREE